MYQNNHINEKFTKLLIFVCIYLNAIFFAFNILFILQDCFFDIFVIAALGEISSDTPSEPIVLGVYIYIVLIGPIPYSVERIFQNDFQLF